MYMHIANKLNLTFLDSLNFIPMKLAKIPKVFGLEELSKGYFPHLFNTKENQTYVGTLSCNTILWIQFYVVRREKEIS